MGALDQIPKLNDQIAEYVLSIVQTQGQKLIDKWGYLKDWNLEDESLKELQSDLEHSSLRVMLLIQQNCEGIFEDKTLLGVIRNKLDASIEELYKLNQEAGMKDDKNKLIICLKYLVTMSYMEKLQKRHLSNTKPLEAA